jgi:two-component system, OmpR family, sensor histidine kinase BaeS
VRTKYREIVKRPGLSRLSLQLFALLATVSVVAVAATAWHIARVLESGFTGYLNAIQGDRLDAIASAVAAHYRENGTLETLRGDSWRRILRGTDSGARESPRPFERDAPEMDRPPEGGPAGEGPPWGSRRPPLEGPGPPRDLLALGPRLTLLDADSRPVIGRPAPPDPNAIRRDIEIEGRRIGTLLIAPLPRPVDARDLQFITAQRHAIATTAGAAVLLSLLAALGVSGLWSRRIRAVERVTGRIAAGEFDARVDDDSRDEIGALARNVNAMGDSLAKLERARRKWLADIAHELRTPLTVLQAELESLIDGVRAVDAAALQSLADEVRQLGRLTDDLHLLALSDLKELPLELKAIDAAGVARRAAERWQLQARKAGLALRCEADARVDLLADEGRLMQLVDNLLANSMRYTDSPGEVRVSLHRKGGAAELIVDDSPPGVPAEGRAGLFEPLYRPDRARSRAKGGSGLGLALARAIVEAHDGTIEARDSPLGGLRVIARIPIAGIAP